MQKIEANSPEARSADLLAGNIEQLKALFPELITEGANGVAINIDVLKALVGDATVTDADEKYGLNWHGKRRARQLALTPSTGTLRPCPGDSVDWDTTQNLMIEGDNLEVLKLLQKSYAGKVKLIYIDPPYNTGKDFVYPDNFQDNIKNYLELTGQMEGAQKISSNSEASGRFHTDWLNMMYPRLKLARNLLSNDGIMLISLDDTEITNLRWIAAEIFGDDSFLAQILWKKRSTPPNDKTIGANHDYIVLICRDADSVAINLRPRTKEQLANYKNQGNHPKGPWMSGDLLANVKGGRYVDSLNYPITNPRTGQVHMPSEKGRGNWRFAKQTIDMLLSNNEIYFGADDSGRPKLKRFLSEVKDGTTYPTIWDFVPLNTSGSSEMDELFGEPTLFESPKPTGLLQEIIRLGSGPNDLIVDFFAGSGSTGHAVIKQNSEDDGKRKYILVQLPEPLDPLSKSQTMAADFCEKLEKPRNIAELTKERLRRAATQVIADNPQWQGDAGFRVFKLDTSNIRAWSPTPDNLEASLFDHQDHLLEGRSEADVLYELLLKLGLDLCVPIEQRTIQGKAIHAVGGGVLLACLNEKINTTEVEALANGIADWHKELAPAGDTTCVFRDSAFADDVAKTNMAAILQQSGIQNVRSL